MLSFLFVLPAVLVWLFLWAVACYIHDPSGTKGDFLSTIRDYQVLVASITALAVATLTYLGVWMKAEYDRWEADKKRKHETEQHKKERYRKLAVAPAKAAAGFSKIYDPGISFRTREYVDTALAEIEQQVDLIAEISPSLAMQTSMLATAIGTILHAQNDIEKAISGNFQASAKIAASYLLEISARVAGENINYLKEIPKLQPRQEMVAEVTVGANRHPSELGYFAQFYNWPA
ncbi:MAG: hypothetical protein JJ902_23580 [Roseibium sp.]|nr:hypothetical protein [Roseibium sp.]